MVVEEFIASAPWTFAKSMPSMPHEYVVSGKVPDGAAFDAFVVHIKEHGFKASWRGRPNTYLEIDGWRYWVMPGRGDPTVTIINRERLPGQRLKIAQEARGGSS